MRSCPLSGRGTDADGSGGRTHVFDPKTGSAHPTWSNVSMIARRATMADGLSTAFSMPPAESIQRIATRLEEVEVEVFEEDSVIRAL